MSFGRAKDQRPNTRAKTPRDFVALAAVGMAETGGGSANARARIISRVRSVSAALRLKYTALQRSKPAVFAALSLS